VVILKNWHWNTDRFCVNSRYIWRSTILYIPKFCDKIDEVKSILVGLKSVIRSKRANSPHTFKYTHQIYPFHLSMYASWIRVYVASRSCYNSPSGGFINWK
jgi:hypothetical protein